MARRIGWNLQCQNRGTRSLMTRLTWVWTETRLEDGVRAVVDWRIVFATGHGPSIRVLTRRRSVGFEGIPGSFQRGSRDG